MKNNDDLEWRLITLDFDARDDPNIEKALKKLRFPQYRVSASKRGYHVRGWIQTNNPIDVREKLVDDSERIRLDRKFFDRQQGMLWDKKKIGRGDWMIAGNWVDYKKGNVLC